MNKKECYTKVIDKEKYTSELPEIISNISSQCTGAQCFDHINKSAIPSRENIIEILELIKDILFPGYFGNQELNRDNLLYHLGEEINLLFKKLSVQITKSIKHNCLKYNKPCTNCVERGYEESVRFLKSISDLRTILYMDVKAALEGDPAAKSEDEVIFSYPGFFAIMVYRIANLFEKSNIPLIPRIMTEYAHSLTGIDIHPGANIGKHFFIDHGTGVVIGETTDIGEWVRIYQGVTLGALSIRKKDNGEFDTKTKRHPTLEDNVTVYSNATILGGETVIGKNSVIGGNVWLTHAIEPDTLVFDENSNPGQKRRKK